MNSKDHLEIAALGRKRPDIWCEQVLGVILTPQQQFTIREMFTQRRLHLRAAHAVGKTFALACGVLCFGCCYSPVSITTTAAGGRQVKRQLWAEIPRLYRGARIPLPGEMRTQDWVIDDGAGGNKGSTAAGYSTNEPGKFTGEHNAHMMMVLDEGHSITEDILKATRMSMQSASSHLIFSGNPIQPAGAFYDAWKSGRWRNLKLDAWEHPNIIHGRDIIPGAINQEWIDDIAADYGTGSAEYIGHVAAEFPEGMSFGIFTAKDVQAAVDRWQLNYPRQGALRLGVDVAWQGEDLTVFCIRDSASIIHWESAQKMDPIWTAAVTERLIKDYDIEEDHVAIDMTGIGSGTVAALINKGIGVRGIHFGGSAQDKETYADAVTEMYYLASKWLKKSTDGNGDIPFAIPPDTPLQDELQQVPYDYKDSKFKIVPKAKRKKLLRRSPDYADAFALTFAPVISNWVY
jgi:hypothetical protein